MIKISTSNARSTSRFRQLRQHAARCARPSLKGDEVTLGHEVAGEVEMLGKGVTGMELGARAIVGAGRHVDQAVWTMGVDYDGGWAEYLVAEAAALVPIPDDLPGEQAAIIPDAVSTPWGAIAWIGKVKPGESVGVWRVGGLGAHGMQLLRLRARPRSSRLIRSPQHGSAPSSFGADIAVDPTD